EFRRKPSRKVKAYATLQRPLPFEVLDLLSAAAENARNGRQTVYLSSSGAACGSSAWVEACRVLESLGGAQTTRGSFHFDYPPFEVLRSVILSGCVPDQKAFQFYPTPETLAEQLVEALEVQDDDTLLEPSAGQGGIACRLPKEQTTCVELSALNCQVLRAKGFTVIEGDFLQWSDQAFLEGKRFSKVAMNPPFSEGRAVAHLEAAARLVSPNGRLVAILPGSMRNADLLPGFKARWSSPIEGAFAGTGVTVAILIADRIAQN
ncbi:MAG: restriction endonuclease subunit M, partial [Rhodocyclaceae bacterium]|nr:restriction endonuclease subunit M [Rhodocyclaceae bacterium]